MVELSSVLRQLAKVGYRSRLWQRAEVKELCNILHEDETILQATNGYYDGGFSLLVATDHRLLLVDHKPMFLTLDSIAYSMIQEISFNYRLLNSTLHIFTSNKCLDFSSWNHTQTRAILHYAQKAMKKKSYDGDAPYDQDSNVRYIPQYIAQPQIPQYMNQQPIDPHQIQVAPVSTPYYMNENSTNTQPNFVSSSSNVNNNLANLALSQKDLRPDSRLAAIRTPGLGQRQYFRRYY